MDNLFEPLLYFQLAVSPVILLSLLFISAPYGKHSRGGWGISLPSRVAWIFMELPAVLTILIMFLVSDKEVGMVNLLFLGLWQFHYGYRTFIYPFLIRGSKQNFPILLVLFALVFNGINGYINGYYLFHLYPSYSIDWLTSPQFIIGTIIFLGGWLMHVHSDYIIRNLRKPGETGHKIPFGGMFRWVSSPNYLGEVIQWTGFAILTWSLPALAFAIFTFANLFPRAISNHQWYKGRFEDYPEKRKVFLPFIY